MKRTALFALAATLFATSLAAAQPGWRDRGRREVQRDSHREVRRDDRRGHRELRRNDRGHRELRRPGVVIARPRGDFHRAGSYRGRPHSGGFSFNLHID